MPFLGSSRTIVVRAGESLLANSTREIVMHSIAQPGARRSLLVTSALLSPSLALALLSAASLKPTTAYAQASSAIPPVVVDAPKPRPKPRAVPSRRSTQSAPAVNAPNAVPLRSPEGLAVPANTATISGESAFSRGLGTSDSASLIADIPGGAVWGAGGVSSLPAINGLGADRIQVAINSMLISPACPNEMKSTTLVRQSGDDRQDARLCRRCASQRGR